MTEKILVVGGYGVFGGYLSAALARHPDIDLIVAGRSLEKARGFCDEHGGTAVALDRSAPDLNEQLIEMAPTIVIDAAGPFQSSTHSPSYTVVEAALACRAHYIDLSDDADFTAGIGQFDEAAKATDVALISGASSVPGISSAAVQELSEGFSRIVRIDSTILPGNRAPRGRSVMEAILSQAGNPIEIFEAGRKKQIPGWSQPRIERLKVSTGKAIPTRWSTFIGAPDLRLFPDHFHAETVHFRAGLELRILQFGLWMLSFLVRWNIISSLRPFAPLLLWIAKRFEGFGSDRGGMIVRVLGETVQGQFEIRTWNLLAEAGDGPHIPTLPARILCDDIITDNIRPGARACLSLFSTQAVMEYGKNLDLEATRTDEVALPLFKQALGQTFDILPEMIRALHSNLDVSIWSGTATVQTGQSRTSGVVRKLIGFPSGNSAVPVQVHMQRSGPREIWTREFGDQTFHSVLKLWHPKGTGNVTERFGPFRFVIGLQSSESGLEYPITRGWAFGIPLPKWMLPKSQTREFQKDGAFNFDVVISLPLIGLLVHYKGILKPQKQSTRQDD